MKPIISIIIPIYNVEPFLEGCLDSVLVQTMTDFELILINDGSTDHSGMICDRYRERDNRIRVIHKENGGVSSARNKGIEIAKGQYIGFIDPDDTVECNKYELLLRAMLKHQADIVVCPYKTINLTMNTIRISSVWTKTNFSLGKKEIEAEILPEILNYRYYSLLQCINKLYKRELFENVKFDESRNHGEDARLNIILLTRINVLVFIEQPLYNYYIRQRISLTQMFRADQYKDLIDNKTFGLYLCHKYKYSKGIIKVTNQFIISTLNHMQDVVNSEIPKNDKYKILYKILNDESFREYIKSYDPPSLYYKVLSEISVLRSTRLLFGIISLKGKFQSTHWPIVNTK